MKNFVHAVTVAVVGLILCGPVHAAGPGPVPGPSPLPGPYWSNIYTAPVGQSVFYFSNMSCNALNSGPVAAKVYLEAHNEKGNIVAQQGPIMLAPGKGVSVVGTSEGAYCKFSVLGSTSNLNAVAVFHAHHDDKYAAALPAQ